MPSKYMAYNPYASLYESCLIQKSGQTRQQLIWLIPYRFNRLSTYLRHLQQPSRCSSSPETLAVASRRFRLRPPYFPLFSRRIKRLRSPKHLKGDGDWSKGLTNAVRGVKSARLSAKTRRKNNLHFFGLRDGCSYKSTRFCAIFDEAQKTRGARRRAWWIFLHPSSIYYNILI
jgi:hypothetical protein